MPNKKIHSLSTKLVVATVLWLLGAILFIVLSMHISWSLENRGVAINDAGSLRKRVYHMLVVADHPHQDHAFQREVSEYQRILANLKTLETKTFFSQNDEIKNAVFGIEQTYYRIFPQIEEAFEKKNVSTSLIKEVEYFVDDLNALVKLIEIENTSNIKILRFFQLSLIGMVIFSAFLAIYLLNRLVITPLSQINTGIEKISKGLLKTRIHVTSKDEFGMVSHGFNQMAESLEDIYENLEEHVSEKTLELAQKNNKLHLLYEVVSFLNESNTLQDKSDGFLNYIMTLSKALGGNIRLLDKVKDSMEVISNSDILEDLMSKESCLDVKGCYCGKVNFSTEHTVFSIHNMDQQVACAQYDYTHLMVFPIKNGETSLGLLTVYFRQAPSLTDEEIKVIELLCGQFAVAIENTRLVLREQQFAVLEERNLMAQGLHDSIAQSLSFLNLQTQMLDAAIKKRNEEKANKSLAFIQDGIQECYDDVRELLLNFRTQIKQGSFKESVMTVIDRFEKQTNIKIAFNYLDGRKEITPQQQLQIVFIIQEALSNIRKHAEATLVQISIENKNDIILSIQDNGVGFQKGDVLTADHVGLLIMNERADRVHGKIDITSEPHKGTKIKLLIPKNKRN